MGTSISQIITVRTPVLGTPPGAATGLIISNLSTTSLTLSWTAPTIGSTPLTYQPQVTTVGSTVWTNIGAGISATTVAVTGLIPNTNYQFEVITSNSSGSAISAAVTAITLSVPPVAPAGLAVVGAPAQTSVTLQWNAPAAGTAPFTYQVAYATPTGATVFTSFATTTTALTQTITGLIAGSSYDFRVTAANGAGTGPASPILANVLTAGGGSVTAPGPATGLAVSALAATSLTLSWVAPTTGSVPFTYQPQQALIGSTVWSNIGAGISAITVAVAGLLANTGYQFQIVTSNASTGTSISAAISATTLSVLPGAPTALTVLGVSTQTAIGLQWNAPAAGTAPLTYQVSVATPSGSATFSAAGAATSALNQSITGLAPATGYDFRVNATNLAGTGPQSVLLVNAQTAAGSVGNAPAAATALTITNLAPTSLTLGWTAPATGTLPFTYQPQSAPIGSSVWTNIGAGISTTTLAVISLTANTGYQFQIVTTNSVGSSTSASVSATTLSVLPGAPTGLAVSGSPAQTSITLQWNAPAAGTTPFTYQVLLRTPAGSGTFVAAGGTTPGLTQTIAGLTAGTAYDLEVTAANGAGTGPASTILANVQTAAASGGVAPSAPANLAAGTITASSLGVSWTPPATGTAPISYIVQWRPH